MTEKDREEQNSETETGNEKQRETQIEGYSNRDRSRERERGTKDSKLPKDFSCVTCISEVNERNYVWINHSTMIMIEMKRMVQVGWR